VAKRVESSLDEGVIRERSLRQVAIEAHRASPLHASYLQMAKSTLDPLTVPPKCLTFKG
jgi:hypothetical protein